MTTFLHKLWDETVAGPTPDAGLGKLRKYDSLPASISESPPVMICDNVPVTRSITILRRNSRNFSYDRNGRMIDSLAGISSPRTPVTPGTPCDDLKVFPWRKSSAESLERSSLTLSHGFDH